MADESLTHFGVKGMRWGVRNSVGSAGSSGSGASRADIRVRKQAAKADKRWERNIRSRFPYEMYNKASDRMNNGGITEFNARAKYKKIKDFRNMDDPLVQEYHRDAVTLFNSFLKEESKGFRNPSGTRGVEMSVGYDSGGIKWDIKDVKS